MALSLGELKPMTAWPLSKLETLYPTRSGISESAGAGLYLRARSKAEEVLSRVPKGE